MSIDVNVNSGIQKISVYEFLSSSPSFYTDYNTEFSGYDCFIYYKLIEYFNSPDPTHNGCLLFRKLANGIGRGSKHPLRQIRKIRKVKSDFQIYKKNPNECLFRTNTELRVAGRDRHKIVFPLLVDVDVDVDVDAPDKNITVTVSVSVTNSKPNSPPKPSLNPNPKLNQDIFTEKWLAETGGFSNKEILELRTLKEKFFASALLRLVR